MLRTILKPLSFVPALIMMYIIFSFSAQDGDMSGQLSYQASVKIIETADYVFNANLSYDQIDEWANKIDFITRKLAHMTEYFALAIAVSFPLYVYGLHGILLMFLAGLICVGFACGDEFHQSFIAGRSPSARDVCIDSVGVFFGIIVVRIIGWTGRKTVFKEKVKVKQKTRKPLINWLPDTKRPETGSTKQRQKHLQKLILDRMKRRWKSPCSGFIMTIWRSQNPITNS